MSPRHELVLAAVLRILRPLVGLLLRQGIGHPAFSAALKRVFVEAADAELARRDMKRTDSAITLMSGVHRRDVRALRETSEVSGPQAAPPGPAGEVVARWLGDPRWQSPAGGPRALPHHGPEDSFDALVYSISRDIRPGAMLDELLRLGVVHTSATGITVDVAGFAPRADEAQMCALMRDNLHDHAAAAAANLLGERNLLEQALYVDEITAESAQVIERAARLAWQRTLQELLPPVQARYDQDAKATPPEARRHRARVGFYVYTDLPSPPDGSNPPPP